MARALGKLLRQLAQSEIVRLGPELRPGPAMTLLIVADKVRDDTGILYASERTISDEWLGRHGQPDDS